MATRLTEDASHVRQEAQRLGITMLPAIRRLNLGEGDRRLSGLLWEGDEIRSVFLHGGGLQSHTWDAVLLHMNIPALVLDLPGHGESAWRDDADYTPVQMARQIAEQLDSLLDHPVVLVGHSLGGQTAIALTELLPDRFSALAIIDTAPIRETPPKLNSPVGQFLAGPESYGDLDEIAERAVRLGVSSSTAAALRGLRMNTRVREDGRVMFKHHLGSLAPGQRRAYETGPLQASLERFDGPVLLLYGDRGTVSQKDVAFLSDRLRHFTAVELESGHNVHTSRPAATARELLALLDETTRKRSSES